VFETYELFCNVCKVRIHATPGTGYESQGVCGKQCWDERDWRRTLAILGKKYYPLGGTPPCRPSEAGSGSADPTPAPSAASPTGASSPPTVLPPSAPAPRATGTSERAGSCTGSETIMDIARRHLAWERWPADPRCPTSPATPTDSEER
jgi:hypothetical protein